MIDEFIADLALRSVGPRDSGLTSRRPGPKQSLPTIPVSRRPAAARPNGRSPPREPGVPGCSPPTIVAVFVDLAWRQLRATAPGEQLS